MRCLFQCAAVAALLLGLAPVAAEAQMMALPHGLYAGVDAGVIVPQDIDLHSSSSSGGSTLSFDGHLNLETGAATGLIVGYHLTPFIALEGNFEYAGFNIHGVSGTLTQNIAGFPALSGSTPFDFGVQGQFNMYNGLVNAIWTPLGDRKWYGFSPYIGAGVGFSYWDESVDSVTSGGMTASVHSGTHDLDFATNGIVGFDYSVMPQLTVGARYRFLYVNMATSSNNGAFGSQGDLIGHVITANATWHF
jgi:opacity protein-like surface antigen